MSVTCIVNFPTETCAKKELKRGSLLQLGGISPIKFISSER